MKRVAILGAGGRLGEKLVDRALLQGYGVAALVKSSSEIRRSNESLTVYRGDAATGEGLEDLFVGCHYAVSAMGSTKPIMAQAISNVLLNLQDSSLRLFAFISWVGASESAAQAGKTSGFVQRIQRSVHKQMFEDITKAESLIRMGPVPYVILRPTQLTDGPALGRVVAVDASEHPPGRVSRSDVARFVIDVLGEPDWEKREMTIGTDRSPPEM